MSYQKEGKFVMLSKKFLDKYYKKVEQITARENSISNKKIIEESEKYDCLDEHWEGLEEFFKFEEEVKSYDN